MDESDADRLVAEINRMSSDLNKFYEEFDWSAIAGTVHIRPMFELVEEESSTSKQARWPIPFMHDELVPSPKESKYWNL